MARNLVNEIVTNREKFLKHLKDDLKKNNETIEEITKSINSLKLTIENVESLSEKVTHSSLIPLGKKIYVNATVKHTGEYFLDKLAFPDSYSVLETKNGTIQLLQNQVNRQTELLKKSEDAKAQIEERIHLFQGSDDEIDNQLPKEIYSDKGIAVKVGDFYEIVEFEE